MHQNKNYTQGMLHYSNYPQTDYSLWSEWPQYVKNEDVCQHSSKKQKEASEIYGNPI